MAYLKDSGWRRWRPEIPVADPEGSDSVFPLRAFCSQPRPSWYPCCISTLQRYNLNLRYVRRVIDRKLLCSRDLVPDTEESNSLCNFLADRELFSSSTVVWTLNRRCRFRCISEKSTHCQAQYFLLRLSLETRYLVKTFSKVSTPLPIVEWYPHGKWIKDQ